MFQRGIMDVGAVDVPKYLVLLVIPLGFFLLTLQFLRKIVTGFGASKAPESVGAEAESANAAGPE
jgi:TRAP-type C4-dicarboxylate transport system permease small subunit